MVLSLARKRARSDVEDDFDLVFHPMEKRSRATIASDSTFPLSQPITIGGNQSSSSTGNNVLLSGSPRSTESEAGSPADVDMDSDDDPENFRMAFSQSPEQPSSWSLRPTASRPGRRTAASQPSTRVPTPIVRDLGRQRPIPLQTDVGPTSSSVPPRISLFSNNPRSSVSTLPDRLPSPVDEDEPHTPTTAAGSQLSLLSVNDMDVDVDEGPAVPEPEPSIIVRKQRQRSGAFISTPEARKFSMGYRDDCDKCRRRVPGHMNHFLGA